MSLKSKKTVGFLKKQIRPITRKNRRTGTENDDSDSDSDSDYDEEFSPLPQQLVYHPQYGPILPVTYRPYIYVYNTQTRSSIYNEEYTDYFINFLHDNGIVCNDESKIGDLETELKEMFSLQPLNKKVITSNFFRDTNNPFKKTNKLGNYSNQIQNFSSDGQRKNYFYIMVVLEDLPIESQDNTSSTVAMNNLGGGSRKRRTNKRRTNKRRTNKRRTNKRRTNKKKSNKRV